MRHDNRFSRNHNCFAPWPDKCPVFGGFMGGSLLRKNCTFGTFKENHCSLPLIDRSFSNWLVCFGHQCLCQAFRRIRTPQNVAYCTVHSWAKMRKNSLLLSRCFRQSRIELHTAMCTPTHCYVNSGGADRGKFVLSPFGTIRSIINFAVNSSCFEDPLMLLGRTMSNSHWSSTKCVNNSLWLTGGMAAITFCKVYAMGCRSMCLADKFADWQLSCLLTMRLF